MAIIECAYCKNGLDLSDSSCPYCFKPINEQSFTPDILIQSDMSASNAFDETIMAGIGFFSALLISFGLYYFKSCGGRKSRIRRADVACLLADRTEIYVFEKLLRVLKGQDSLLPCIVQKRLQIIPGSKQSVEIVGEDLELTLTHEDYSYLTPLSGRAWHSFFKKCVKVSPCKVKCLKPLLLSGGFVFQCEQNGCCIFVKKFY